MKVWIVYQTYLYGDLLIPKVFTSGRAATLYWEQMNVKLLADFDEQNRKGQVYRPGIPEFLRISEQEI